MNSPKQLYAKHKRRKCATSNCNGVQSEEPPSCPRSNPCNSGPVMTEQGETIAPQRLGISKRKTSRAVPFLQSFVFPPGYIPSEIIIDVHEDPSIKPKHISTGEAVKRQSQSGTNLSLPSQTHESPVSSALSLSDRSPLINSSRNCIEGAFFAMKNALSPVCRDNTQILHFGTNVTLTALDSCTARDIKQRNKTKKEERKLVIDDLEGTASESEDIQLEINSTGEKMDRKTRHQDRLHLLVNARPEQNVVTQKSPMREMRCDCLEHLALAECLSNRAISCRRGAICHVIESAIDVAKINGAKLVLSEMRMDLIHFSKGPQK